MTKWRWKAWTSMWCTLHLLVVLVVLGPQKAHSQLSYSGKSSLKAFWGDYGDRSLSMEIDFQKR